MMLDKSTIQHRLLALLCAKQESRHWDSVNKQKEKTLWGTGSRNGGGGGRANQQANKMAAFQSIWHPDQSPVHASTTACLALRKRRFGP